MSTYTGDMIRKNRIKKGLTQKQLGKLCGIADSNIRKYELGNQNPKVETLQKIAYALDIPIEQLLAGKIIIPPVKPTPESILEREEEKKELDFINKMDSLGLKLNDIGRDKALEQVELLTKIPEYRKDEE